MDEKHSLATAIASNILEVALAGVIAEAMTTTYLIGLKEGYEAGVKGEKPFNLKSDKYRNKNWKKASKNGV